MKKYIAILVFVFEIQSLTAQEKKHANRIGLSVPVIMNSSEGMHYLLGNRILSEGTAFSSGLSFFYARDIFKRIYLKTGLGYFKQSFSPQRYTIFSAASSPTRLPFYTKSYHYNSIWLTAGLGYRQRVNQNYVVDVGISYDYLYSFHQKYKEKKVENNYKTQSNHIPVGTMTNFSLGLERKVRNLSVNINVLIPVIVRWNEDVAFFKYTYANDTQKIAVNKFSIGSSLSFNYNF